MPAYSPLDVVCTITGPGGVVDLGANSGLSQDGIVVEWVSNSNTMQEGLDGRVIHNKSESSAGTISFSFLGISDASAKLDVMYTLQVMTKGSLLHGKNHIFLQNTATGETIAASNCAFQKRPSLGYKKELDAVVWVFDCEKIIKTPAIA